MALDCAIGFASATDGFMNGLDKSGAEEEQLVLINAQPTGLKPHGLMGDQIQISTDFTASLDEFFRR